MLKNRKIIIYFLLVFVVSALSAGDYKAPVVAILPFEDFSNVEAVKGCIAFAEDFLFQSLYDSGKVRLIEMKNIGEIIEGEYVIDGRLNRKNYLEAVKNLGAELIFFVEFTEANKRIINEKKIKTEVTISGRMVRLLNGEVISMETITAKKNIPITTIEGVYNPVIKKCLKKLSRKVTRKIKKYFKT